MTDERRISDSGYGVKSAARSRDLGGRAEKPGPAKARVVPMSEKQIEAEIIKNLTTLGLFVTKTSQPRASMVTPGLPDLYVRSAKWGIRLWVEVKTPKGKLSFSQQAWHVYEQLSGGYVVVARSTGDVLDALKALGAPIR